jgi:protein gp37
MDVGRNCEKEMSIQKTKIEWVRNLDGSQGYSWNPIQGACPVGCWYCYAQKIYKRFKLDPRLMLVWGGLFPAKPSRIFVCSTMELFHPEITDNWRNRIFSLIEGNPEHTFIILTKMPENIDRPMPDNVWIGVSITEDKDIQRLYKLHYETKAKVKFVSFEPLLSEVFQNYPNGFLCGLKWIIIGRLTGHGHSHDPKFETIRSLVNIAKGFEIPVFLKNNLRDIWKGPLIQEWPK